MGVKCKVCNSEIPEGRLKVLPGTRTCVEHSTATAYAMRTIAYGITADDAQQEFEIIRDPKIMEKLEEYTEYTRTTLED
jgi:hypothetical protein